MLTTNFMKITILLYKKTVNSIMSFNSSTEHIKQIEVKVEKILPLDFKAITK